MTKEIYSKTSNQEDYHTLEGTKLKSREQTPTNYTGRTLQGQKLEGITLKSTIMISRVLQPKQYGANRQ